MKSNRTIWKNLVAIEGIDGAGKTTLARGLKKTLTDRGIRCRHGYEPTDKAIGRLIRQALADKAPICPESLALLFAADRIEHVYGAEGIRRTIDAGGIYISDRYLFSSLAYQSVETDWKWVERINAPSPLPGFLLYLNLPFEEAMHRLSIRKDKEIYENEEFLATVLTAYARSMDHYKESGMSILSLDAREAPEEILLKAITFLSANADSQKSSQRH